MTSFAKDTSTTTALRQFTWSQPNEEVDQDISQSFTHQVSVYDQIKAPTTHTSVFRKSGKANQENNEANSQPRRACDGKGTNIIAEYLGGAVACDAYHMTDPQKDSLRVSSCVTKASEEAGVSPGKSVIRHALGDALGAAGGLEAIAAIMIKAINTGWLHPTINQWIRFCCHDQHCSER
ncbi:hypothetical protein Vadar_030044 [Vaccinium darrowii]|uniref:Uncharacterized protein n=1 Tax=Vaccinium darrowii TaxID=229202 RepID=A0ACB7XL43_9ERIC|nr:hypothetical protein Vadar_030044 [Vaccinium darrowii]